MPLQAIETQRLYRQIAGQLRALIAQGEFVQGQRLPAERDLALALGVSRPTVREALIALEVEGVIEVRTGSGIYVCPPPTTARPGPKGKTPQRKVHKSASDWGPLEVLSARLLVESEVAALAAAQASRSQLNAMAAALKQMQQEATRGEVPRNGDHAFHVAIAQACGNGVLTETVQHYWSVRDSTLFKRFGDYFENPVTWQQAIDEHERIYHALRAHDVSAARRAMQHHLRQAHKRFSASWRSTPLSHQPT